MCAGEEFRSLQDQYTFRIVLASLRAIHSRFSHPPTQVNQFTCSAHKIKRQHKLGFILCAGEDSNLRRPKPTDLQSVVIDHSTTDAFTKKV